MMRTKQIIYWFLGPTAGRALAASWHWFWGMPLEGGGKVTLEAAKESLSQMQTSVQQLADSVSRVMAIYKQAKSRLEAKQTELSQAEERVGLAIEQDNEELARFAIAHILSLEKLIPQLQERVDQAQAMMDSARQKLQTEREKLATCKLEMGNLKAISEMNEALSQVMNLAGEFGIDTARSHFETSEQAIKNRHVQVNSQFELSQDPQEQLEQQLEQLTQSDAIEQRMAAFRQKRTPPPPLTAVPDIQQDNA